jgi:ABC-type phosphate transport system substrate-binding protein
MYDQFDKESSKRQGVSKMIKRSKLIALGLLLMSVAIMTAPAKSFAGATDSIAIVAAKNFPVDGLTLAELKQLYMGNSVQAGGRKLTPLTYPTHSAFREKFDKIVLGMSMDQVDRYWIDRKVRGQAGPPKMLDSEALILRVVSQLDGAIGFVFAGNADKSVKILRINGKLPTDTGYPIR